ncbi:hypothetical protein [Sutterella wadsworthensis]|uniref:hypothetical protein n=1 Tax=Sutterella wadsworthensis TaxID=40545 RepID=UPI003A8F5C02
MPKKTDLAIASIERLLLRASSIEVARVGSGHSVKCLDKHRLQFARLVIEVQQKKGVPATFVTVIDHTGRKTTPFYGEQPLAFFEDVTGQKAL